MKSNINIILSSGVALGAYVPPLLVYNHLKALGYNAEFFVIENLIDDKKKNNIIKNKFAFHRNFKIALTGQKLSERSDYGINSEKVQLLYKEWDKLNAKKFSVFSGFWTRIVEDYILSREVVDYQVYLCHLDADISTSWKNYTLTKIKMKNIWMFNLQRKEVAYYIKVTSDLPKAFKKRSKRFVIHGGGWGMGTYVNKVPELKKYNIDLDIINYEPDDIKDKVRRNRYFMIDPEWRTWEKYNSHYIFPPFKELYDPNASYDFSAKYPSVYDLIRNSYGIISKPGGATLIDSFSSSTPIIFLEPYGEYERSNAELWKSLGFGLDFKTWLLMNCQTEVLGEMHNNLKKALSKSENFISIYASE